MAEALHTCNNGLKESRKNFDEKSAEFQEEFDEQSSVLISAQSRNEELLQKVESFELEIENLRNQIRNLETNGQTCREQVRKSAVETVNLQSRMDRKGLSYFIQ